jgi:hypothetical protein
MKTLVTRVNNLYFTPNKTSTMYRLLIFSFLIFICKFADGQTSKEDSIKAEIIKLSQEWNLALINKDSLALDRILSPEYILSSANGSLLSRKEWMNNTLHGLVTDSAAFIGPQKITVYANEAISEAVLHWKVKNTDKNGHTILRNTETLVADIWRFNDGRWQVIRRISKLLRKL